MSGHIVYVDAARKTGPWDGRSWPTAFRRVQEGLDAAAALVAEAAARPQVWVARGLYKPAENADRAAAFRLRSVTGRQPRPCSAAPWVRAGRRAPFTS